MLKIIINFDYSDMYCILFEYTSIYDLSILIHLNIEP